MITITADDGSAVKYEPITKTIEILSSNGEVLERRGARLGEITKYEALIDKKRAARKSQARRALQEVLADTTISAKIYVALQALAKLIDEDL